MQSSSPLADRIRWALEAPKAVHLPVQWVERSRAQSLELRASLLIGGILEQGFSLGLRCASNRPDERLSISLFAEVNFKPVPFARLDWRGSLHINRHDLCGKLRLSDVGTSHFHDPRLCANPARISEFLADNLSAAVALDPEPVDYAGLLETASVLLNIHNLASLPIPPWQYTSPLL